MSMSVTMPDRLPPALWREGFHHAASGVGEDWLVGGTERGGLPGLSVDDGGVAERLVISVTTLDRRLSAPLRKRSGLAGDGAVRTRVKDVPHGMVRRVDAAFRGALR